jgi:adenylate cyclase
MNLRGIHIIALVLLLGIVWAFVTAPPPLPVEGERSEASGPMIPIERVFRTIAAENDQVRALYTAEIVGAGKKVGLAFDEDWEDDDVQAGPLPALFLRKAADSIAASSVPLRLFLGSHFPIKSTNAFKGEQVGRFEELLASGEAQFFLDPESSRHTAMFPDVASAAPCVTCHNEHPDSPKVDWKLDDIMGATTWLYPKGEVSEAEFLEIIGVVRAGFRDAYRAYLAELESFAERPSLGERWPAEGFCLPDEEAFMGRFSERASAATVDRLIRGR